jgi:DNA-binding beta-propeller fold protein YncE
MEFVMWLIKLTIKSEKSLHMVKYCYSTIHMFTLNVLGEVTTWVGSDSGFSDGPAAKFSHPTGVTVHQATGAIYISDYNNHRIRKITPEGM